MSLSELELFLAQAQFKPELPNLAVELNPNTLPERNRLVKKFAKGQRYHQTSIELI